MQATDEYHGRKCDTGAYCRNRVDAVVKAPWQLLLVSSVIAVGQELSHKPSNCADGGSTAFLPMLASGTDY
jgi:hypothetical protein